MSSKPSLGKYSFLDPWALTRDKHGFLGYQQRPRLAVIDLKSEATEWQQACVPTPVWAMIRDFIHGQVRRDPWEEPL